MITDSDLLEVREYLGLELCRGGGMTEGSRNADGLSAVFRVIKESTVLHQLMVFASVFDHLRGQGTPVRRFLRERQVAERMKTAGKALVVVRGINIAIDS